MHTGFPRAAVLAIVLAGLPAISFAQAGTQLRLSWDHCAAEGYVADRSFACDSNTGGEVLYASAVLGDEVPHENLAAFEAYIDFRLTSSLVPPWWQVGTQMCRQLAVSVQGSGLVANPPCTPWYLADGITRETELLSNFQYGNDFQNAFRVNFVAWLPTDPEVTVPNGSQEYLFARVRIQHSKSTGTDACEGCLVPVCIGFGLLKLDYPFPAASPYTILGTTASTVTWQGAYVTGYSPVPGHQEGPGFVGYHGNLGCSTGPVPASNRTWGTIKTLYR